MTSTTKTSTTKSTGNGRTDATLGMGIFTRLEADAYRGMWLDYYEPMFGDKRDGKIVSVGLTDYVIRDRKTNARHTFNFRA